MILILPAQKLWASLIEFEPRRFWDVNWWNYNFFFFFFFHKNAALKNGHTKNSLMTTERHQADYYPGHPGELETIQKSYIYPIWGHFLSALNSIQMLKDSLYFLDLLTSAELYTHDITIIRHWSYSPYYYKSINA